MDKTEFITLIANSIAVPFLVYLILVVKNYLHSKIKSEKIRLILDTASTAVTIAVKETAQTYTYELKKAGKWTPETQANAFELAYSTAKDIIGPQGLLILKTAVGDVNEYITALIESEVLENNREELV